ncbi:LacI family DNA-binding transcriptional regulator [Pedobacter cryoconitis]|uniref:LacI family transcriptional regulator n=1 Tax=Pedobacter cryoconitis TaxID=188932 RepID=A0A7X0MLE6_9SPHI|nr:LacI family DNA-binding transcriptional regulator [Pedobacter cryoconitis]MBB6501740.1 LacI family transcriptional regulator [Pedobacter cryoconitis]
MENVTLRILADKLNLSVTTVSKALRDSYEISEPTKQKVRELATALHYTPNAYARSLRTGKSETIGVVLPEVADHFFALVINGIESVAKTAGYHVLIYLTHEDYNREKEILEYIRKGRIDGLLISVTKETTVADHITKFAPENIPVIFFDRMMEQVEVPKVVTNDFESCYQATQHLLDSGCKQINLCTISDNLIISKQRIAGYIKALQDNNIPAGKDNILFCREDDNSYTQIYNLLKSENRPDGIISLVDKLTLPVYIASEKLGLTIPGELKLVSYSNNPSAGILNPSLTTVSQPAFQIGQTAAKLLISSMGSKRNQVLNEVTVIPSNLVIRASSGQKTN